MDRRKIKEQVQNRSLKILFGTDAAAEGLNLQSLQNIINIDIPWNPTRLEQRLGRIRRIGQTHRYIQAANLRYSGSVEEKVFERLSERFEKIRSIFGTLPDSLRDVWVETALGNEQLAEKKINELPSENPFRGKYAVHKIVEAAEQSWGFAKEVLDSEKITECLRKGW
jgi:superfamily II DNA/RNA helicase